MERLRRENLVFMLALSQSAPQHLLAGEQPGIARTELDAYLARKELLNLCAGLVGRGFHWGPSKTPREGAAARLTEESEQLAQRFRAEPDALNQLIEGLRKLFDAVADGQRYQIRFLPGAGFILDASALHAGREGIAVFETPEDRAGFIQGVLLGTAFYVTWSSGEALVRRCAREACRRVFLATRPKQIFCTRRCASAAVFERYKEKLGKEEYRSKRKEVARRKKKKIEHAKAKAAQHTRSIQEKQK
jgi:hypothetical protein